MTSPTKTETKAEGFPKTIEGKVFNTADELKEHVAKLTAQAKEGREYLRVNKPSRPASPGKALGDPMTVILNANADMVSKAKAYGKEFVLRITWNHETGKFEPKLAKSGSGGGVGQSLTVDGKEFPSAKAARDTLHPEDKDKSQGRQAIINMLKNQYKHTVSD